MDPNAEQHPGPAPRASRLGKGVLATGAAVVALGIGAVGASAGGSSSEAPASAGAGDAVPGFVQDTTPERPADPQPRGDEPCPEPGGSGGSQQDDGDAAGTQTPDASDAAVF